MALGVNVRVMAGYPWKAPTIQIMMTICIPNGLVYRSLRSDGVNAMAILPQSERDKRQYSVEGLMYGIQ